MREPVPTSSIMNIQYHHQTFHIGTKYQQHSSELLVFLHGLGLNKDTYHELWNYAQFQHYSLVTRDFIGFGESSKPDDFSYAMEDQASIMMQGVKHFTEEKIHVVMHSMGGAIGVLLAEQLKDKLGTLVNVEGNLIGEDCGLVSRKSIAVSFEEFKTTLLPQLIATFGSQLAQASPVAFYTSAKSLVSWSDSGELLKKFLQLQTKKCYFYGDKSEQW
jgi:pimeloyl-ACP methyl ester carboxylesterase